MVGETEFGRVIGEEAEYLSRYGDADKSEAWIRHHIMDADCPPVAFCIEGRPADRLVWNRQITKKTTFVDYADTEMPAVRCSRTVRFICEEYEIGVEVLVTEYPGYPVVDYEATLINLAHGNSPRISELFACSGNIYSAAGDMTVQYWNGADIGGEKDYREYTHIFRANAAPAENSFFLSVDNGKPTSTFLPNFSLETEGGDGVISILSWQGSWRQELSCGAEGIYLRAGQHETDFVLLEGESHRLPEIVLIFFRKGRVYGQNIYRRWFWKHNFMRQNGFRYGVNVLIVTGPTSEGLRDVQSTAEDDRRALRAVREYGFHRQVDRFAQDAGWTEYGTAGSWWDIAGNWNVDCGRYPGGLKEIAEICGEMGLEYTLWMEPERAVNGQKMVKEHPEWMIFCDKVDGKQKYFDAEHAADTGKRSQGLVNLGNPDCLAYIADMINTIIKEQGVGIYRQDFNFCPAHRWEAYDGKMEEELGIPRRGRSEEMHCNGYLALFDRLLAENPGLNIDACAAGAMRYDLATARRAHCHTRTDWYQGTEKAQSDTYTTSKWMMYWGTGFEEYQSRYGIRSRLAIDIGIGVSAAETTDFNTYFSEMSVAIKEWRELTSYMLEDYYPLTAYLAPEQEGLLAMQYDCPSRKSGMVIGYVRGDGIDANLCLYALQPDAAYEWYDYDDPKSIHIAAGRELMETGLNFRSGVGAGHRSSSRFDCTARVYVYKRIG